MEDILSSIKRIIADGSDRASVRAARRKGGAREDSEPALEEDEAAEPVIEASEDDTAILELTDMVDEPLPPESPAPAPEAAPAPKGRKASAPAAVTAAAAPVREEQILSDISAQAARQSLSQLSSLLVRPSEGEANTLEGLVREMLRPMLKDWLETNLPELVESMVKKEIDRIVGRLG